MKTIGIVAISGALKPGEKPEDDKNQFKVGIKTLEDLGFKVKSAANVYESHEIFHEADYFTAGDIETRVKNFHSMWSDPEIDIVYAMKGGYGCMQVLEQLDFELIAKKPKAFLGYSDLTCLFNAIQAKAYKSELPCFHAPMSKAITDCDEATKSSFNNTLNWLKENEFSDFNNQVFLDLNPYLKKILEEKKSIILEDKNIKIKGGNLCLCATLMGTKFQPNFDNSILFLEDLFEEPYKTDRLLYQLQLAGCFEHIKELWLGEPWEVKYNMDFLNLLSKKKGFRILENLPIGHKATNITTPLY